MSDTAQLTAEQLAAGREKRRGRLFEKHCDGARLTADERAEISDLIGAAEKSARANQLELEPSPTSKINKRTGLAHPIAHYAAQLDVGLRTVKRWLAVGVKARDACPLDDLPQFGEWWKRVNPGRAPDSRVAVSIEKAIKANASTGTVAGDRGAHVENREQLLDGASKEGAPPAGAAPAATKPLAVEPSKPLLALGDVAGITFEQDLSRAARIHAANMELLERAFASGSHVELDDRQRKAERSQRMLHVAQTAFDEHLKQRGDLLPREEVKRELLRVHTAMAQSLVGVFVQVGVARERAIALCDSWYGHLRQSRFATATAPELRPAAATAA